MKSKNAARSDATQGSADFMGSSIPHRSNLSQSSRAPVPFPNAGRGGVVAPESARDAPSSPATPRSATLKVVPLDVDCSRVDPRQRLLLYKLAAVFLVVAAGAGLGDYFITSPSSVYNSGVLGIGCGLIVVVTLTVPASRR